MTAITYPLVSICIPAYNCEDFIVQCLHCLCDQTYRNIELIVVNDGSTDDTFNHAKSIRDDRITIIDTQNGGAASARNIAYQHSKGSYIIFFDADDYVKPNFIRQQLGKMANRHDVVVLSAWGRFYKNDLGSFEDQPIQFNEMLLEEWINHFWYHATPMTNPGRVMIPRTIVEKAGLWNEALNLNDDLEFFTRIFLEVKKIVFNPEAKFYYRSGVEGLSSVKTHEAYQSLMKSIDLSTALVLERYYNNSFVKKSCANLWKNFLYEVYPVELEMSVIAERKISELGGASFPFPAGGITKFLSSKIGWKATKKIKFLLAKRFKAV